jgi:tetratricopeptide (TPR) repeat protein
MSHTNETTGRDVPFSVGDLFSRYLQQQVDAHAAGLGYAEPAGDAVPHEIGAVQPVDPQLAFKDAVGVAAHFLPGRKPGWSVPSDWPALVNRLEPAVALSFSLGNFPQLVRNLYPLLTSEPAALRQGPNEPLNVPGLLDWATRTHDEPGRLLAAAVLRLARHFDEAEQLLSETPSETYRALHANEVAALAWHRGAAERALKLWRALPDTAPVLFNRGMAALFLGDAAAARESLDRAIALLPETSAWHHLASLYRTLAAGR